MKLTEIGLMQNPKSYSAWFYRCWILENVASSPDWKRELNLCEKFLEIDERNCTYYLHFFIVMKYVIIQNKFIIIGLYFVTLDFKNTEIYLLLC